MSRLTQTMVAVLLLALPLAPSLLFAAEDSLAGSWVGEIEQPDSDPIEIRLDLSRAPTGEWLGALLMPDRQQQAAELQQISVGPDGVRFGTPHMPGAPSFTGKLQAEGAQIAGDVTLDTPPPPPGTDIYLFDHRRPEE